MSRACGSSPFLLSFVIRNTFLDTASSIAVDGSSWSSWVSTGGPNPSCCIGSVAGSRAAAASWGSDRVDLFSLGLDHGLWQNTWTSETGNSGWVTDLGYPTSAEFIGDPGAVSRAANYINVFMRGNNGDIYTETWNGSAWSGWTDIGSCPPEMHQTPPSPLRAVQIFRSTNEAVMEISIRSFGMEQAGVHGRASELLQSEPSRTRRHTRV